MSDTPVESLRKRIFFHDLPPSVDLNTPRSAFGPKKWPNAPTYTTSGLVGSTITFSIWRVSPSPM